MKRIAIFQSELGVGGIQKSLINLLKNLDYEQLSVDLYLSRQTEFWDVEFPEQLRVHYMKPVSDLFKYLPFEVGKRIAAPDFSGCGEYDLAIDFNSYQFSCAVGACTVPARRRVMWVHNNVEIKLHNEWKYRVLWRAFRGKFRYYDRFICVSRALVEPFQKMSGMTEKEYGVIQNYIDIEEIRRKAKSLPEGFSVDESCVNFVALGKLCHQKGYDIMLEQFAGACRLRDDLRLYILGGGPDELALKEQAHSLSLEDKVFFLGNQNNPYAYMQQMDAFLSTSRYEGQPLNIMEAMVIGLPLYCTRNLEQYTEGLVGRDDMVAALAAAQKEEKRPDDLLRYNGEILEGIVKLANS